MNRGWTWTNIVRCIWPVDFLQDLFPVFTFLLPPQTQLTNEWNEQSLVALSDAFWFAWIFLNEKKNEPRKKCNKFTNSSTDSDQSK